MSIMYGKEDQHTGEGKNVVKRKPGKCFEIRETKLTAPGVNLIALT